MVRMRAAGDPAHPQRREVADPEPPGADRAHDQHQQRDQEGGDADDHRQPQAPRRRGLVVAAAGVGEPGDCRTTTTPWSASAAVVRARSPGSSSANHSCVVAGRRRRARPRATASRFITTVPGREAGTRLSSPTRTAALVLAVQADAGEPSGVEVGGSGRDTSAGARVGSQAWDIETRSGPSLWTTTVSRSGAVDRGRTVPEAGSSYARPAAGRPEGRRSPARRTDDGAQREPAVDPGAGQGADPHRRDEAPVSRRTRRCRAAGAGSGRRARRTSCAASRRPVDEVEADRDRVRLPVDAARHEGGLLDVQGEPGPGHPDRSRGRRREPVPRGRGAGARREQRDPAEGVRHDGEGASLVGAGRRPPGRPG